MSKSSEKSPHLRWPAGCRFGCEEPRPSRGLHEWQSLRHRNLANDRSIAWQQSVPLLEPGVQDPHSKLCSCPALRSAKGANQRRVTSPERILTIKATLLAATRGGCPSAPSTEVQALTFRKNDPPVGTSSRWNRQNGGRTGTFCEKGKTPPTSRAFPSGGAPISVVPSGGNGGASSRLFFPTER